MDTRTLHFFATQPHECSYLQDRRAVTLFADPKARMSTEVYSRLTNYGFRRSGEYVYRPDCPTCKACLAARIKVDEFVPSRRHKRVWQKNADLRVTRLAAGYRQEHFDVYQSYIRHRHAGGGMDDTDPEKYRSFLCSSWCDTYFYEFRLHGRLLGVAVVDQLLQGLSAVYTFYDNAYDKRSLGVYSVLWQIEEAKRMALPWLYLGYWIKECPKMSYKDQYRPLEVFQHNDWHLLEDAR